MRKLIAMLAALVVTMVFAGTAAAAISITPAPAVWLPEPVRHSPVRAGRSI